MGLRHMGHGCPAAFTADAHEKQKRWPHGTNAAFLPLSIQTEQAEAASVAGSSTGAAVAGASRAAVPEGVFAVDVHETPAPAAGDAAVDVLVPDERRGGARAGAGGGEAAGGDGASDAPVYHEAKKAAAVAATPRIAAVAVEVPDGVGGGGGRPVILPNMLPISRKEAALACASGNDLRSSERS
jgi:hypothetical protein